MEDRSNLLNSLFSVLGEFLNLRTDAFKKNIITSLSVGFSRGLSILIIAMILLIVLTILAFAFIILLGEAMGSFSGAAFIVGTVYIIGAAVLFFMRKKLFLTMFTNLFTGIMNTEEPADRFKTLLSNLVRDIRNSLES